MITKNRQSRGTIINMANKAFPDKQITEIKELTEGMCNVTYDIAFNDGSESILKIAAKDRSGNTSNEVNLISDAEKRNIDIGYEKQFFMNQLEEDKSAFREVSSASLVHWDMWEGNVFVKDGHVSGIIDWERALWGEAFMDDRFRMHNRGKDFLNGFGQTTFSEDELKRMRWYDVILYLTMMIEVFYRGFEDKGQYFWAKEMLEKSM